RHLVLALSLSPDTMATQIYTLSLHDALPIFGATLQLCMNSALQFVYAIIETLVGGFCLQLENVSNAVFRCDVGFQKLQWTQQPVTKLWCGNTAVADFHFQLADFLLNVGAGLLALL